MLSLYPYFFFLPAFLLSIVSDILSTDRISSEYDSLQHSRLYIQYEGVILILSAVSFQDKSIPLQGTAIRWLCKVTNTVWRIKYAKCNFVLTFFLIGRQFVADKVFCSESTSRKSLRDEPWSLWWDADYGVGSLQSLETACCKLVGVNTDDKNKCPTVKWKIHMEQLKTEKAVNMVKKALQTPVLC